MTAAASTEEPGGQHRKRRWLLPTATGVLVALGIGAIIGAALAPDSSTQDSAGPAAPSQPAFPVATPTASNAPANASRTPIAQLAAPAWVARIAEEGNIPERALAAYAGAALSAAQTNPGCQIGWNTLAAIGQVESLHGTMNSAHLDDRGVATPTIIGIPLDGKDTTRVTDTDRGQVDGDTTWDRAVGPMQFIPATWAQVGQDGNHDGAKDINQIDDAALAAAVHLCEVGGDLAVAQNWITAISAYNDSVDYNSKVAEAANQYASLR